MNTHKKIFLLSIVSSMWSQAYAGEYNINGFASLTGGMTLDNDQSYLDYDDKWSMRNDTKVGFQLDADLENNLSATIQIMSRGKEDYDAELEWGYINYALTQSSDVKFGKLRLPIYYYSSSLDVGYSYDWIRPPQDVYRLPISSYEGLDYSKDFALGQWSGVSQIFVGSNRSELNTTTDIDLTQVTGFVLELSKEDFNSRISATNGKVDSLTTSSDINYYSISLSKEFDHLTLLSEFTLADISSRYSSLTADEKIESYLISTAYRFNQLSPYLTYSKSQADAPDTFSIYGDINESSWIYGLRWDFNPSASFKAEFIDHTDKQDATNDAQLANVSIDFIF